MKPREFAMPLVQSEWKNKSAPRSAGIFQSALTRMSQSEFCRKYLGRPYRSMTIWIWNRLPAGLTFWRPIRVFGVHLQTLIQLRTARSQSVGTFFFRNRPEQDLLVRLLGQMRQGPTMDLTVLGCSKGPEVYSISYAIRCAPTDINVSIRALDISKDILEFAEAGVYSLTSQDNLVASTPSSLALTTSKDQPVSIFERMSSAEMEELFDREEDQVKIKPRFREGITWHLGDAGDPGLVGALGLQDIVVANRFLCHMYREDAEKCLRNLARLVKPGGYLFVSGVDLDVRTKVAQELGWRPVMDLMREIHDGDRSLHQGWPLEYWGLEPFDQGRIDWKIRYASVFQIMPENIGGL
jgi:chemotaxis methyl-accepting protein methylase